MTFKAIVGIVLGAMLANNYALEKFLGAAPLLGWSAQEKKIVDEALDRALDAAECIISCGVTEAQNRFN